MYLPFLMGLLAAASNATSNVLQRGAHVDELSESNQKFSFSFLIAVMRRPRWLLGIVTMLLSFLLQALGLGLSSLAVIQPLIVLELPFALIAATFFLKESMTLREWTGATLMFGGVILFVTMLSPSPGNSQSVLATPLGVVMMVATAAIAGLIYLAGLKCGPNLKTALLGISAGIGFGLAAVVIKDMTVQIANHGFLSILTSWQLYTEAIIGLASIYVFQHAISTGRLMYAQPGVTLADPFVAVIWGVAFFNESVRGGVFLALALVGVAMSASGVFLIVRGNLSRAKPKKIITPDVG